MLMWRNACLLLLASGHVLLNRSSGENFAADADKTLHYILLTKSGKFRRIQYNIPVIVFWNIVFHEYWPMQNI
jgi:hypothetical protein